MQLNKHIHIENKLAATKVYIDGEEIRGIRSVEFSHCRQESKFPCVKIELLAERISVDTPQIFALPEVYHPFYVSSDSLIELGILTIEQFNDLTEKGLL